MKAIVSREPDCQTLWTVHRQGATGYLFLCQGCNVGWRSLKKSAARHGLLSTRALCKRDRLGTETAEWRSFRQDRRPELSECCHDGVIREPVMRASCARAAAHSYTVTAQQCHAEPCRSNWMQPTERFGHLDTWKLPGDAVFIRVPRSLNQDDRGGLLVEQRLLISVRCSATSAVATRPVIAALYRCNSTANSSHKGNDWALCPTLMAASCTHSRRRCRHK